jgi:hypothetical protein
MFIKIKKETLQVGAPILNGEPIIIKTHPARFNNGQTLVKTCVFTQADTNLINPMSLYLINNEYVFDGTITSSKAVCDLIIGVIKKVSGLQDSDFNVISEDKWNKATKLIRIYIPYTSIIDIPAYKTYIDTFIANGDDFIKYENGYVIYVTSIQGSVKSVLKVDPNVLYEG